MKNTKEVHAQNVKIAQHLSKKYTPIDTNIVIKPFLDQGWRVSSSRRALNTKGINNLQEVVLRNENYKIGDDYITIQALNSFDGSKVFILTVGIFRLVCSNGLVVLTEGEHLKIKHIGENVYEKLDEHVKKINVYLETVRQRVELLKNSKITNERAVIQSIVNKLYAKDTDKYKVEVEPLMHNRVYRPYRQEDKGIDAWTQLNVIQENIVRKGGLRLIKTETNKETNEVKRVNSRIQPSETKDNKLAFKHKLNAIILESVLENIEKVA